MTPTEIGPEPRTGSYFVSAYPPFSVWNRQGLTDYRATLATAHDDDDRPWGIYVHVPYCVERCHFCYYLSHDKRPEEIDRTVAAIVREAACYAEMPAFRKRRPTFVYFGGGTPSLLSVSQLGRLLTGLRASFDWRNGIKVTRRGRVAARRIQSGDGIVCEGTIEGDIETDGEVALGPKSSWKGKLLQSRSLSIADGATLNGVVTVPWHREAGD